MQQQGQNVVRAIQLSRAEEETFTVCVFFFVRAIDKITAAVFPQSHQYD